MEKLNDNDLAYLAEANLRKVTADTAYEFVKSMLTTRYNLAPGDQVTPDGTIIRLASLEEIAKEDSTNGTVQSSDND